MPSDASPARVPPPLARVLAAFAAVYVIWGSTYLAIRFAIETMPPLLMAGARFMIAGALVYGFMRWRGEAAPTRRHWRNAAIVGGLLLLGGNGGVVLAERTVPSGVAALLVAMVPLWMVLLDWARPGGTRPAGRTVAGLVVGFAGMVMLVGPAGLMGGGAVDLGGAGLLMLGSVSWAAGSIFSRGAALPKSAFVATGMEMLSGGALLFVAGLLRGEWASTDLSAFSTVSVLSFAYLVLAGSLVGYTAYIWLLGVSTPARVSTYAYVNPIVAVFLGWLLAGEPVTARVLVAAAIIIAAVVVITVGRRAAPVQGEDADAPESSPGSDSAGVAEGKGEGRAREGAGRKGRSAA